MARENMKLAAAAAWFWLFAMAYLRITGKTPPAFEWGLFAQSLLQDGTYGWGAHPPWAMAAGHLTAHKGPLTSWWLLPVYAWLPTKCHMAAIAGINAWAEAWALMMLFRLVPEGARAATAGVFCLSPFILLNVPAVGDMAVTHALLTTAVVHVHKDASSRLQGARIGALLGLATLSLPISLLFLPLAWAYKAHRPRVALGILLGALTVLGGWTARNAVAFHRFMPVGSNLPLEIYYGNNPAARGGLLTANCTWVVRVDETHQTQLAGLDEPTGYGLLGDEGLAWVAQHPWDALRVRLRAFVYFWHGEAFWRRDCKDYGGMRWQVMAAANLCVLLLGAVGLTCVYRQSRRHAAFLALAMLLVSGVYTLTHADIAWRYRAPLEPLLCALMAMALTDKRWLHVRRGG